MNHYFHLSFRGFDADGEVRYYAGILSKTEYKVTKAEIDEQIQKAGGEENLQCTGISYMGRMTEDEFKNGTSA
ncbi:hypothetical protein [Pseudomonas fluorescens]|uniref:hypothetical protein n=1 Tax=Pseudomonas fluorescens TaxID=294 RepID=UPI0017844DB1|nr:hypothetical protein [Pseudomonas fluorescens]